MNKQDMVQRVPPQSLEAEQSFLGALMIDKDAIIKVADMINVEDFYKKSHAVLYEVIKDLYARGEPIDILSITNRLEEKKKLDSIGGRTYLVFLSNFVATSANIVHYSEIVQKKATLRRLIAVASTISTLGYDEEQDIDQVLDKAEQSVFNVAQNLKKDGFAEVPNLLDEAYERLEELTQRDGSLRGISSGFKELDYIMSGLQKSDLLILAARPSVGKTTFALDIARETAVNHGNSVAIFSLEMGRDQLVDRLLCSQSRISLFHMRSGNLNDKGAENDYTKIANGMAELSKAKIYIDDNASCTVMDIRTKARRLATEGKLDLIIVDYLQLMEGGGKSDNRVQEIAEISRGLKQVAREIDVPVLALSQLSRAVESRQPSIPKLSDLRDSGSIEQDADIVMFLYRKAADRNYNREDLTPEEMNSGRCYISKHRNGPTGEIDLNFDSVSVSFGDLIKVQADESSGF